MTKFERLDSSASKAIVESDKHARALLQHPVTTVHLLLALLEQRDSPITRELSARGLTFEVVLTRCIDGGKAVSSADELPRHLGFSDAYSTLLDHAFSNTMKREYPNYTDELGLLLALAEIGAGDAVELFSQLDINRGTIEKMVTRLRQQSTAA